jgi:rhomboid protease GluP
MPEKTQSISAAGYTAATLQALAYGTLKELGWTIKYAGENILLGYTPRSWNRNDNEITVQTEDGLLTVTSKMVHNEAFDMMGRTKKDVAGFVAAFETVKARMAGQETTEWAEAIEQLKETTIIAAEQEIKQAEEVDKAMNLSTGNLYVTYAIIAINVIVFILMAMDGAGLFEPDGRIHAKWGSNYSPLTLSGDSWRLVTNIFIHFGLIHILMNLYALYSISVYLEPMIGKLKFITAYLAAGILASLTSLWWHSEGANSAGASGAIFGMYGLFIALLLTKLIPDVIRKGLLPGIAVFVVYNLAYGMKGGIDNAAHIGGLVSGFVIGFIYSVVLKQEKNEKKANWALPAVAICTIAAAVLYLQNNQATAAERNAAMTEIKGASYKDSEKFNDRLNEFGELEKKAISVFDNREITEEELKKQLQETAMPQWEQAETMLATTKSYDIPEEMHSKAAKLIEYIGLRKEELNLLIKMIDTGEQEKWVSELNQVREKMGTVIDEISKL